MRPVQTPTHSRHYSLFQKTAVNSTTRSLSSLFCKGSSLSSILAPGKFSCYSKHSATNRGVLVVSPAGNEGILSSATNLAPWMFIVAVSSTDRDLTSVIMIGNGAKATGESLSLFEMNALSRIISAFQAFAGYFTPYQSIKTLYSLSLPKPPGLSISAENIELSYRTLSSLEDVIAMLRNDTSIDPSEVSTGSFLPSAFC
ncbi:hypothetical protein KIW84_034556 [Lathyrus oleraceus]|uniref:Uncharacterized protein n=1 Tax=Pisum sativum TaxID=3888 RepID=A0A9D4Y498_PEA|nr:hypothetical protein KIW84_034556 [Pisum sativum]